MHLYSKKDNNKIKTEHYLRCLFVVGITFSHSGGEVTHLCDHGLPSHLLGDQALHDPLEGLLHLDDVVLVKAHALLPCEGDRESRWDLVKHCTTTHRKHSMARDTATMDATGSSPHLTSFLMCSQHECCGDVTDAFRHTLHNYQFKYRLIRVWTVHRQMLRPPASL